MADAIGWFIDAHVRSQSAALDALNQRLTADHPLIATFERK